MGVLASGSSLVPRSSFTSPAKMRIPLSEYFSLVTFRWLSASLSISVQPDLVGRYVCGENFKMVVHSDSNIMM